MLDADPNEAAAAPASVDTGFDTTPFTATVNPAPAPAPATVETGFGDLDGTPAPVQPAAPTVNTVADTGKPEDPDADLDARVAALLPNKSITDWNAVTAFMAEVVAWPGPDDPGYVNLHCLSAGSSAEDGYFLRGSAGHSAISTSSSSVLAGSPAAPRRIRTCGSARRCSRRRLRTAKAKHKAIRFGANALAQKSIWIDVDIKPNSPKHCGTEAEALKAVLLFIKTVKPPRSERHRTLRWRTSLLLGQQDAAEPSRVDPIRQRVEAADPRERHQVRCWPDHGHRPHPPGPGHIQSQARIRHAA